MQKVYLLLRNNQQTGPHSLEELIQLNLKPHDLIWVEGKSYGWSYPSEIESLKPFAPATTTVKNDLSAVEPRTEVAVPANSPKKIFVSLPHTQPACSQQPTASDASDAIERKAEELRQRIHSYASRQLLPEDDVRTNYSRSLNDVEEEYTSWMYQKKSRKRNWLNKKHLIIASITAVGLTFGWFVAKLVFKDQVNKPSQAIVQNNPVEQPRERMQENAAVSPVFAVEMEPVKKLPAERPVKKNQKTKESPVKNKPIVAIKATTPELIQNDPPDQTTENKPVVTEQKSEPAVAEGPKEKKKTLKQILGGLFKKNKQEETTQEQPRPSDNSNNERTATRRDEAASGPATVDLADQVDVKTNKNSQDWMMGVQGLKLTLYNQSASLLTAAFVEVLYYSEQNSLLDKKIIHFSNIGAKKSQTLAAPDHRLADHVDYKIISATGSADAYAKQ